MELPLPYKEEMEYVSKQCGLRKARTCVSCNFNDGRPFYDGEGFCLLNMVHDFPMSVTTTQVCDYYEGEFSRKGG
jgi:hypothetical protein